RLNVCVAQRPPDRGSLSVPLLFSFLPSPPSALYTLSLHDALPIFSRGASASRARALPYARSIPTPARRDASAGKRSRSSGRRSRDRKSTRLNSSHLGISYAVFCLKKKKHHQPTSRR